MSPIAPADGIADVTVHIGVHRTGTTSLQHALGSARPVLADTGVTYPVGHVLPDNHLALGFACVRPERLAEAVPFFDHLIRTHAPDQPPVGDPAWPGLAQELVDEGPTVLSTETLAWIRHDDEAEALFDVLGDTPRIVVTHRDPADFLASYHEMSRFTLLHPPDGPDSIFYTGADSWMADAEARIEFWCRHVGDERVEALDYDETMAVASSMTPVVAAAIGLDPSLVSDHAETRLNQRSDLPTAGPGRNRKPGPG